MRRGLALILSLGLAACVVPGGEAPAPQGVVPGDAIATTALPPLAAGPPPGEAAATEAEAAEPAAAAEAGEAATEDPAAAPAPRSRAEIACERRGGLWSRVIPGSDARACVFRTRDSGRRCDAGTDCQGDCLARSGTCSPVAPLFGCHEILDDTGRRMTQCIE